MMVKFLQKFPDPDPDYHRILIVSFLAHVPLHIPPNFHKIQLSSFCLILLTNKAAKNITSLAAVTRNNAVSGLLCGTYDHTTPLLRELHWLKVPE